MPDLDSFAAEFPEARDLLPEGLGDRTDHRHGLHLLESHPRIAHDVRRHAELPLAINVEECVSEMRFDVMWHRHTGQWFLLARVTLSMRLIFMPPRWSRAANATVSGFRMYARRGRAR